MQIKRLSPTDLFLVVLDGKFKSAEIHALLQQAPLVDVILAGCVIENHFKLSRVSSLSQQVFGEHLALLGQLLIVIPGLKKSDATTALEHLKLTVSLCVRAHVCEHDGQVGIDVCT